MRALLTRLYSRLPTGLLAGLGCGFLVWLLSGTGPLQSIEHASLDSTFRRRGSRPADPNIIVLVADDATVVRAQERYGRGWPLPRSLYAEAVAKLKKAGAKTVAFDILFADPSPRPDEDLVLEKACREAGNVVQAGAFQIAVDARQELPANVQAGSLRPEFMLQDKDADARRAIWAAAPLPKLAASAAAMGHVNVFPAPDGALRRVPHLMRYRAGLYPSLALAGAAHFLGQKPAQIVGAPGEIRVAGRQIPTDDNGETLVNWIGANRPHPTYGLSDFLDGNVPDQAIRGRLVLIGVTALGAFEHRATPLSGAQPMVEFQANALDDIVSNRLLRPAPPIFGLALLVLFPIICGVWTERGAGRAAWGLAVLGMGLWLLGLFLLRNNLYLPVGLPLFAGALSFAITAVVGFRSEWEGNTRADTAMATLVRGATLLSAGRDRERLVAVIRATARDTLNASEVFLVCDEESDAPLSRLARHVAVTGQVVVWPPALETRNRRKKRRSASALDPATLELFQTAATSENAVTLVAAPLPRAKTDWDGEPNAARRQFSGALIVAGRRDNRDFTARDGVLLEALTDQAALALENFQYGEMLRGRVELANRELSGAYRLLAEQSAKLFAAVESIDAALVVSDQNGAAAFVNPAGAQILQGATPILGESVVAALESGDLPDLAALFQNWQRGEISEERTRLETTRGDNILSAQFTPLLSEENQPLGAMLVVTDVTAQRALDRMKTDFVGFVAHELRTPLTAIMGYASLLEQGAGRFSAEQMKQMTETILRHCRRLNRMISDLLDVSKLEAGKTLAVQKKPFDLAPLCERLLVEQKTYLNPTPPIELIFDCPQVEVEIEGDADRLEQVVINLLSNAVKYSPDGGKITLSLRKNEREVELEVRDEGMGMSPEQLKKLFQKFYRTDDARAMGIKGTGLGLNLVKQLIEAHGGRIEVESARGKGSTFRAILPVA